MESSIFACSFCGKAERTEIKILKKNRPRRIGPMFSFEESMYSANIAYPIRLNLGMSAGSKAIAHCTTAADLIHQKIQKSNKDQRFVLMLPKIHFAKVWVCVQKFKSNNLQQLNLQDFKMVSLYSAKSGGRCLWWCLSLNFVRLSVCIICGY